MPKTPVVGAPLVAASEPYVSSPREPVVEPVAAMAAAPVVTAHAPMAAPAPAAPRVVAAHSVGRADADVEDRGRRRERAKRGPSVALRVALRVLIAASIGIAALAAVVLVKSREGTVSARVETSGSVNGVAIPKPLIPAR